MGAAGWVGRRRGDARLHLPCLHAVDTSLWPNMCGAGPHFRPPQTTLLDVLAGHTYSGTVGGQVRVNGKPRHLKSFLRIR